MAIQIKSLKTQALPTPTEADVYIVPLNKAAIVKGIRLVNIGAASATINLFVRRATTGNSYRIVPKDLTLAPGAAFIDDSEITLEGLTTANGEDRIRGAANSGATVDCVISGIERDVS
jgi:hypothetical protein